MKTFKKKKIIIRFISFLVSLVIWIYVVSSAEIELRKRVPFSIELPKNYSMKTLPLDYVEYKIKGPGLFVRKFADKKLAINIPMKKYYKKGKKQYQINIDENRFKMPLGVSLTSIEPQNLRLALEKSRTKKLKVKPVFETKIEEQFAIKDLSVFPKYIEVTGPKSLMRDLKFIETKPISSLKGEENALIELESFDGRFKMQQESVNISYTTQSKNIEFTYTNVPIIFQSANLIAQTSAKTVSIKVTGEESLVKSIVSDNLQVVALIPRKSKTKLEVDLIAELPQGIKIIEIKPKRIKVSLERE